MMLALLMLLSLLLGSFANAVVWRLHQQEVESKKQKSNQKLTKYSLLSGRSMCPHCKHQLSVWDLVPILSWLLLKGKCRYCSKRISVQYPLVELATVVIFLLSYLTLNPQTALDYINLTIWLIITVGLVILAVYDLKWMILPDKVQFPLVGLAFLQLVIYSVAGEGFKVWLYPALAGLLFGGMFYMIVWLSRGKGMGGGDIKLVFLIGLILGFQKTLVALLLAFNVAAIISIALIILKIKSRKDVVPFGPFLIVGLLTARLYGEQIINWYLNTLQ